MRIDVVGIEIFMHAPPITPITALTAPSINRLYVPDSVNRPISNPSSLVTPMTSSGEVDRRTSIANRLPTPATTTPVGIPATINTHSRAERS